VAHIHLPDGSFTLFWVLVWWACALPLIGAAIWLSRKGGLDSRKITVTGFVTAAAFAAFLVEVPLFGGVHLNLTPLIGILVGPVLGSLVVFIVNILSAATGHGGWGLIGANSLVNFSEVLIAWLAFRGSKRVTANLFSRAGIAAFAGLFMGNLVMVAIILISGIQGVSQPLPQILAGLSIIVAVNLGAAIIEAFLTGFIVEYIGRVRPGILNGDNP
jgi:cobalt/nickel transport system permease protein